MSAKTKKPKKIVLYYTYRAVSGIEMLNWTESDQLIREELMQQIRQRYEGSVTPLVRFLPEHFKPNKKLKWPEPLIECSDLEAKYYDKWAASSKTDEMIHDLALQLIKDQRELHAELDGNEYKETGKARDTVNDRGYLQDCISTRITDCLMEQLMDRVSVELGFEVD